MTYMVLLEYHLHMYKRDLQIILMLLGELSMLLQNVGALVGDFPF